MITLPPSDCYVDRKWVVSQASLSVVHLDADSALLLHAGHVAPFLALPFSNRTAFVLSNGRG
jgi:hypothetical protein